MLMAKCLALDGYGVFGLEVKGEWKEKGKLHL